MPYELFLALRYVRARRGRRVARWTALAAVFGIACGVAALTLATALANGFRDELQDKILRGTAHVTLSRSDGRVIEDPRTVVERVRRIEGVLDASPTTYEGALLSGPGGTTYTLLRGLDAESARAREKVRAELTKGSLDALFQAADASAETQASASTQTSDGTQASGETQGSRPTETETEATKTDATETNIAAPVVLGEGLAERTGLTSVGDEGWVLTGADAHGSDGYEPRSLRVRVAGLFRSGLYDYDSTWTYASLEEIRRVAGARPSTLVVSIETRDIYTSDEVARRVRAEFGKGWTTLDWREANRPLFAALALERRTVALIIMLVTIIAALNITTTLALVVVERRADIAVLCALGARPRSITLIFLVEGALVGAAGALAGVVSGLAACFVAERFHLIRLPPDVYSLSSVPLHPHGADVLLAALAAFAVSLLATLYPARQAARVRPAEVLRYE